MDGNLAMANILEVQDDHILRLTSMDYCFDYITERKHTINLNEIIGFNIDYRLEGDWYIEVITKERDKKDIKFKSYFLDGWFNFKDIRQILSDTRCNIYNIRNLHGNANFHKVLKKVLPDN